MQSRDYSEIIPLMEKNKFPTCIEVNVAEQDDAVSLPNIISMNQNFRWVF